MDDLDSTFGALLIGLQFSALLFGILTLQFYLFYRIFYQDPLVLRVVVGILWILTTLQLCFLSHAEYSHLVTNHVPSQENDAQIWSLLIHIGITAVVICVVQCFFIERLWNWSGHNVLLTLALLPFTVARLVIGLATTVVTMRTSHFTKGWITACFASLVPTDVLICAAMLYFLRKSRRGMDRTEKPFGIVTLYTLSTGLLPCMLSIAALICYLTMSDSMVFIAIHFVLGQLYTSSMLVILNARTSFGGKGDSYYPTPHFLTTVHITETADATLSDITPTRTHATDSTHSHNRRLTQINTLSAASLEFRGNRPRSPTTPVYHVETADNPPAPDTPALATRSLTPLTEQPPRHAPSDSGRSHLTGPSISWESLQSLPTGNFDLGDPLTRSVVPGVPQIEHWVTGIAQ